ncbi:transglycosylase SLT domain-containing protein [Hyphomicrobium sp. xq]|uniref:Transglycosylase SLT domain-containing protein n=1 Tax=Hyphomicrobium album TaxID=2665159 RepID=A0A6I3KF07_9HYPH|nr:D-Ala-D-Ala carboxypeptidase family metallohydrolase [Hyphomicrobium album]MTD92879.1 transglycosylase SLT domain-containing protein [Hyphomicrobium album]
MTNAITNRIAEEAERRGLDPYFALATAKQESNFNPLSRASTSSAFGIFQFIDDNWKDYGIRPGAPETYDPETQVVLGVDRIKRNYDGLSANLGRSPEPGELYLAHVFGLRGSSQILAATDDTPIGAVRPEKVWRANPWVGKNGIQTVGQLKTWFKNKTAARMSEVSPMLDPYAVTTAPETAGTTEPILNDYGAKARLREGAEWPLHHFKPEHFRSKDGAPLDLNMQAALALDRTREEFGEPFALTSAHRSETHNRRVGGASGSRHVHGDAFDIDMTGMAPDARERLLLLAMKNGFTSFGFYANSPDMLHVDTRQSGAAWFRDGKGKNFLKWGGEGEAANFPANHWAAGVMKSYFRRGQGPTGAAIAAAENPKHAAGVDPTKVADVVQPPGIELPPTGPSTITAQDSIPAAPYTTAEIATQEREAAAAAPGIAQTAYDSVRAEWGLLAGGKPTPFTHDPQWSASDDWIKENMRHLPLDYWDGIQTTVSEAHARDFVKKADEAYQIEQRLAATGAGGFAARLIAATLDPVAIAAMLATEGAMAPYVLAAKGARYARIVRGATSGVVSGGAAVGLLYANKPGADGRDVAYAMAGGLILGGLFNAGRGGLSRSEHEALAAAGHRMRADLEKTPDAFIGDKGAGAAVNPGLQRPLNQNASEALAEARANPAAKSALGGARFDATGSTLNSAHPLAAKTMDGLAEDAVGRVGHERNTLSATEYQSWFHRKQMNGFYRAVRPAWEKYRAELGIGRFALKQRAEAYEDFMQQLTRVTRDPTAEVSEHARAAATKIQDQYEDILAHAKDPGMKDGVLMPPVKGFEDIKFNRQYAPRIWLGRQIAKARAQFGDEKMERFLAQAWLARRPVFQAAKDVEAGKVQLDPAQVVDEIALSEKFGKLFWKRLREHQADASSDLSRALSGDDLEGLREQLIRALDDTADVAEEDVDKILASLKLADQGGYARAKQRALFDEAFSAQVVDKNGVAQTVRFDDFLENNMERLFGQYSRNLSGAISMARAGYNSVAAFERRLEHIKASADEVAGYGEKDLNRDLKNLSYVGTMLTGSPIGDFGKQLFRERSSTAGQWGRFLRDVNFTRLMGQLGFAQVAETGNILGTVGIRAALTGMPAFRALWRNIETGELGDDLARELEAAVGLGTDRLRGSTEFRYEDFGNYLDPYEDATLAKMSGLMEAGKMAIGELSGANMVNTVLHRWTMRAVAQKFSDISWAKGAWTERRLAAYGLDKPTSDRISAELRKHAVTVRGALSSKKLTQLNLDKWDPEIRETFEQVMYRVGRHIIQENDPGNLAAFMSRPFWQLVTQFRVFVLAAHSKQLLHGIHLRDATTTTAFLGTSVTAGLAYMLQTHAQSLAQRDPKKFRKERLSVERIGAAAFGRAGWSALVPTVVDNLAYDFGYDTPFGMRTSGLGPSGLLQNPTWDFLNSAARIPFDTARAAVRSDIEYSEQDFKRFYNVLPFKNTLPVSYGLGLIGSQLPEKSR